ncbi:hypothetical protein ArV2_gp22 [Arthrobacter phage vB_ArS-ArV2]|uniref:Uncharacterized protein n=1 Tax=Arthrobacter phage vB_ArS-ArV2 TaxID=1414742 RepID=V5RAB3_9CAUD|nr:hypothetical protein ArV2_gp22 [Arthrobacter phage vB_ArS-ArV2]AHB31635.1 hypothetical protein ArV2_gp22 [Arthrobacter phage vB_ArS-ArV2]
MADHRAETTSPKVMWPLIVGLALTALAAALAAVTPDMLAGLGPFAVPAALGLLAAGQYITGYLKRDPLREAGQQAIDEGLLPPA